MTSVTALRQAIATALDGIDGLRVSAYLIETAQPPIAIVSGPEIDYHEDTLSDVYRFPVYLLVSDSSDRPAQELLDSYLDTGAARAALETADLTSAGGQYLSVTGLHSYGIHELQNIRYFGAIFDTSVVVYR